MAITKDHYMYYINENGNLRTIPLSFSHDEGVAKKWSCTPPEKYIVTGLYLEGKIVDAKTFLHLIDSGLKPIEPFLFDASNLAFKFVKEEFRDENEKFQLNLDLTK